MRNVAAATRRCVFRSTQSPRDSELGRTVEKSHEVRFECSLYDCHIKCNYAAYRVECVCSVPNKLLQYFTCSRCASRHPAHPISIAWCSFCVRPAHTQKSALTAGANHALHARRSSGSSKVVMMMQCTATATAEPHIAARVEHHVLAFMFYFRVCHLSSSSSSSLHCLCICVRA